jgi:hypothetical protein
MNGLEKYVVSKTLRVATWENTTFLRGEDSSTGSVGACFGDSSHRATAAS